MKTFKELTLDERTQIGQYYNDGLKSSAIAPLYGTNSATINNVITFLRGNGVIIPFKIKRKEKKAPAKELLILPTATDDAPKKKILQKWSNADKREAYRIYRHDGIKAVMARFKTTEIKAYYLSRKGRDLNGVKSKRQYTVKPTQADHNTVSTKEGLTDSNIGFFFLGMAVTALIAYVI